MNEDDKLEAAEIQPRTRFGKWLDNFWFHYKWPVIGVAFLLVVFLICTLQTCGKEDSDISVLYAGPVLLSDSEREGVRSAVTYILPSDINGDGKKYVDLITYQIYSEEQIKVIEAETDISGVHGSVNRSYNSNNYDSYYNYLLTGETSVLLLDPSLYEVLVSGDRLQKLTDVLGYTPEGAVGEYGVRLGDTEIYKYYSVMQALPEDTVVCILRPYVVGKSSKEKLYEYEKQMFRAIVEFRESEN